MEQPPQTTENLPLKRLRLDRDDINYFEFWGIPVYCELNDPEDPERVGPKRPAMYAITQDMPLEGNRPGETLSIWIWEGVPKKFKEVLVYHEVVEGYLIQTEHLDTDKAHQKAKSAHNTYAGTFLSAEDLAEFEAWQSQLPEGGF